MRIIFFISAVLFSKTLAAQFADVTVNGNKIDPYLFDLAKLSIEKESDYCVPGDDEWTREYIVMYLLTKSESERYMQEHEVQLISLIWDAFLNSPSAAKESLLNGMSHILRSNRKTYHSVLQTRSEPVSNESIALEYDRLKGERHPLVTDVVFVKYRQLSLKDKADAKEAERLLGKGFNLMDLYAKFDPNYRHDLEGKHWVPIAASGRTDTAYGIFEGRVSGYADYNRNVRKGEVLGPRRDEHGITWYIQIVDKIHLNEVNLQKALPGESDYLQEKIRSFLQQSRLPQLKKKLREEAVVRVDGELVYANDASYSCGRVWPKRQVEF